MPQKVILNDGNTVIYYNDLDKDGYHIPHRKDGPAVEHTDGETLWMQNGKFHRLGGPAIIRSNGDKLWMQNHQLHREDGPAEELADGTKRWYWWSNYLGDSKFGYTKEHFNEFKSKFINSSGQFHCVNEPYITIDGTKWWYYNGKLVGAKSNFQNLIPDIDNNFSQEKFIRWKNKHLS